MAKFLDKIGKYIDVFILRTKTENIKVDFDASYATDDVKKIGMTFAQMKSSLDKAAKRLSA